MATRIPPLTAPYPDPAAAILRRMMPGDEEPIALFRTFAHHLPLSEALNGWGAYQLSRKLSLSLRDREIVIDRTCARCGCGVRVGRARRAVRGARRPDRRADQLPDARLQHRRVLDDERDRLLIDTADALHDANDIDDALWTRLDAEFSHEQLLDLLMLCGWYHAISFTARATRLAPEPGAQRFTGF